MQSIQTVPDPKTQTQAPDIQDDPTIGRVLISQVLIEEYESMDQPELSEEEQREFKRLKEQPICTGETVRRIYRIIRSAQQRKVKEIRAEFENKYEEQITDATLRQQAI